MTVRKPHHVTFRKFPLNQREYAFCASCAPARLRKSAWIASSSHEKFGVCSPCKERIERINPNCLRQTTGFKSSYICPRTLKPGATETGGRSGHWQTP